MTRTVDEVVAAIDAAVEGRCAGPGCGRLITFTSPSAWWCSPECMEAWHINACGGDVRPPFGVADAGEAGTHRSAA